MADIRVRTAMVDLGVRYREIVIEAVTAPELSLSTIYCVACTHVQSMILGT